MAQSTRPLIDFGRVVTDVGTGTRLQQQFFVEIEGLFDGFESGQFRTRLVRQLVVKAGEAGRVTVNMAK